MSTPVLVTGATGNVGRTVVAALLPAGVPVRAANTDPERTRETFGDTVEPVRLDFTDPATWEPAYRGVQRMFLMRPPHLGDVARDMVPSLRVAWGLGVHHVVLLSLQGAERNPVVPHARLEAWLRGSGMGWTFVRPSFFMENLSTTHAADIRDRDEIMVPAGRGATAFVAAADVGAVAAAALRDPSAHRGRAWTPTGPEALTYHEVAAELTMVLDRPIQYRRPGVVTYARHASSVLDMPRGMVLVTSAIYSAARLGLASGLTDDVRRAAGREPTSFADWAQRNREVWALR